MQDAEQASRPFRVARCAVCLVVPGAEHARQLETQLEGIERG